MTMTRAEIATIFPDATDEQISNLLNINGSDINKAKSGLDALRNQLSAAQAEAARLKDGPTAEKLQAEIDRANGLQQQLDAYKQADTLRQIREKVAGEKKIPVTLLTGETEEACAQQADAILAFAKPGSYPTVPDGGEPTGGSGAAKTRDSFAGWFEQKF